MNFDDKLLYVSPLYIETIKNALYSVYDESIVEYIQLYDFKKTHDEYELHFINILTNTLSYMLFIKASMEIVFTDELGKETIL